MRFVVVFLGGRGGRGVAGGRIDERMEIIAWGVVPYF